MKKVFILLIGVLFGLGISSVYAGPHASKVLYDRSAVRKNIVLPQVDGLNCYSADLHVHTNFSDGNLTPEERVKEAWIDGLDILAITDHIETRKGERAMLKFLKGYSPDKKGFEPINTRCSRGVPADERGIVSDLNYSVKAAQKAAKGYPELTIIKGTEISREPVHIGHYCALFTKDNNTIYSTDDAQTIRNARAQGALITHNHPGWERTSCDMTEFEKKIYAEGLIDGIEISNSRNFYPEIVRRAIEKKFYMVSATDCHSSTASVFGHLNFFRDMTLIFAKDKSENELRKALLSQKTLGYCGGYVIGEESLLAKFFKASVTATLATKTKKGNKIILTNNTSIAYKLNNNSTIICLPAHGSVSATVGEKAVFTVENMYHVDEKHPTVELTINK